MQTKTLSETRSLLKNRAAMMTVQRITVVISRRKKICALEGAWLGTAPLDIRGRVTETAAKEQLCRIYDLRFTIYAATGQIVNWRMLLRSAFFFMKNVEAKIQYFRQTKRMKAVSRRSFLIVFGLSVTCLTLRYVGNYFYGYSGMSGFPITLQFISCIVEYLMFPMMLLAWVLAAIRNNDPSWTSRFMVVFLAWSALTCFLPRPSQLIASGLRDRIIKEYGVTKLRQFAHDFDQLPQIAAYDSSSRKIYMRTDLLRTGLAQKYPFLAWMKISPRNIGPSYIAEKNRVVDVRWGGALWGHWGFSVALDGKCLDPVIPAATILKVSDEVYFIREWD